MSAAPSMSFSIVCLSSQDWAVALPTNRQQVMRRAAERGHDVLFVETGDFVGKHLLALVRGPGRSSLARRLASSEAVYPGVTVRKTLNVLPLGQRFRLPDRVNGAINRLLVRRVARRLPRPTVAWLYDPRATWAIGGPRIALSVYDCVDDYAHQVDNRRGRALVAEADRRTAADVDLVFATTRALQARHLGVNPETHLVGNVGDFAHFAPAADRGAVRVDLENVPRPVLGFAGNIATGKVDLAVLERLATRFANGTLLIAGPADDRLEPAVRALATRPNVTWLGPVPYPDLPSVVAAFDVALIPYEMNDYTRNVFPLKLYEYLAAGKPVVATGLPELEGREPDVVVAGETTLAGAVEAALELRGANDVARRQALARANTWESRTTRLLELVGRALETHDGSTRRT